VIPKATILIENPIAVPSTSKHQAEAKAFVKFLRTPAAQKIFAQNGYRPVVSAAARGFNFPTRPQLFTIKYAGGWAKVEKKFFDPRTGIMTRFQGSSGG
jgi:sulfate transport system substrate-binding protein